MNAWQLIDIETFHDVQSSNLARQRRHRQISHIIVNQHHDPAALLLHVRWLLWGLITPLSLLEAHLSLDELEDKSHDHSALYVCQRKGRCGLTE